MKNFFSILFAVIATVDLTADLEYCFETSQQIDCFIEPISPHSSHSRKRAHTDDPFRVMDILESTSTNWSGYAAASNLTKPGINSVTKVSGVWTVPQLTATPNTTYCSIWVGIDGYTSSTVEQLGTEHDWNNGQQSNYAWFEMYPKPAYEIVGFPVNVNDSIGAEVKYTGNNNFVLSIVNYTQNVHSIVPGSYTKSKSAQRSSAEWIVEAPSSYTGVLPLSNFGTAFLSNCVATIKGVTGPINNNTWKNDALTMQTRGGILKALPSSLAPNGKDFSVTWYHQ